MNTLRLPPNTLRLAEFELFHGIDQVKLKQIEESGQIRNFLPGSTVDTPRGVVLIVVHGEAECYLNDAAGQKFLLSTQRPGAPIGELSHLVEGRGYEEKVTVVARTDLIGFQLPVDQFLNTILSNQKSALSYLGILASRLADMNRFGKQAVDVNMDPSNVQARNLNERLADAITNRLGSFRFLGAIGVISAGWVALNAGMLATVGWDPYPFVFLNLMYSVMSGMTLPVILLSQNRQAQLDRQSARVRHLVTLNSARQVEDLRKSVSGIEARLEDLAARLPHPKPSDSSEAAH